MLNLTSSERALAKRSGTSTRLLAHRLSTFTAEQAATEGPGFQAAWRARHGETGSQPKPAVAVTKSTAPAASAPKPSAPVTPPAIAAEIQAAENRKRAEIARAAAAVEAKQKAEQEAVARRAAADSVWAKAYDTSPKTGPTVAAPVDARQAASDAVWDRANAKLAATRAHIGGWPRR